MMIDARNFSLEDRLDLHYDIRDGRVNADDVIWKDEDLVKDLISIIHCFSARIYGLRRSQRLKTKIEQVIEDTNKELE